MADTYTYTIKEPPHAYMAHSPNPSPSPTSERTLVYYNSHSKLEEGYGYPMPAQKERMRSVLCSKTCMWSIIVLFVVLGISLAVSLAVVLT